LPKENIEREADVASVILTSVKFDMFKWFNPTKVSFIRDRLTFYGFKEIL
jgi:hypothetical protein